MEVVQPDMEVVSKHSQPFQEPPKWIDPPKDVYTGTSYEPLRPQDNFRVLGLKRRGFFVVYTVIIFVLLAAVVGGTTGGYFSGKAHAKTSTSPTVAVPTNSGSTSTPTTNPSPSWASFPTTGLLPNPCPSADNSFRSEVIQDTHFSFQIKCGVNFIPISPLGISFAAFNASSIEECIHLCAWQKNRGVTNCTGVTLQTNITVAEQRAQLATCWLVTDTANSEAGDVSGAVLSAVYTS